MLQADGVVSDDIQNQLMVLAISDVARIICAQLPAAAPSPVPAGGKGAAAKPVASKPKKDEPKPVQVCCRITTLS